MRVSEIYSSRQGEGRLTGQDSVFVRTSGCNLRCDFCDTPYTSWAPEGETLSLQAVIDRVQSFPTKHVVITGGEPMLQLEIVQLTYELRSLEYHLTIETAGTVHRDVACDLMSISPKLANSTPSVDRAGQWAQRHEEMRWQPEVLRRLVAEFDYQLKFVVADPNDLKEIQLICEQLGKIENPKVLLMPEGTSVQTLSDREQWIKSLCDQYGYTYCPRMHVVWYGNQRGT